MYRIMAGFLGKIFQWFANEHLVGALARNRTFQQVALKIDSFLTTNQAHVTKSGEEMLKKGAEVLKEQSARAHQATTSKAGFDFVKFGTAFKDEIMKDVANLKKK